MGSKKKPKGLGDVIEKVTKATGIKSAVKTLIGEDCGCEERREKLNDLFPMYKNIAMDASQKRVWESLEAPLATGRLRGKNSQLFRKLYDELFEKRHSWCGCGNESARRIQSVRKIYEYSCDQ